MILYQEQYSIRRCGTLQGVVGVVDVILYQMCYFTRSSTLQGDVVLYQGGVVRELQRDWLTIVSSG